MLFGGVIGATVLAKTTLTPSTPSTKHFAIPFAAAAASPTSNEDAAHEAAETPAQEAAENNGTARPGGAGHTPNETAAHEAAETPAREAAEHATAPAA
jgi:hypothetical protein